MFVIEVEKRKPLSGTMYVVDNYEALKNVLYNLDLTNFENSEFPVCVILSENGTIIVKKEIIKNTAKLIEERERANAME